MKIGVTMPVLTNIDGAFAAINTIRSAEHLLHFHVVNNRIENCSVAESWNVGCAALFDEGVSAVVVANDDILCSRVAIDALVECWRDTGAGIVAARNMRDHLESDLIVDYVPQAPFEITTHCSFGLFLLPRQTWDQVGRFDENFAKAYFEDDDYWARAVLTGLLCLRTSAAPYYHFRGTTAKSKQNLREGLGAGPADCAANERYFIEKWGHSPVRRPEEMKKLYYPTPFNNPCLSIKDWPG